MNPLVYILAITSLFLDDVRSHAAIEDMEGGHNKMKQRKWQHKTRHWDSRTSLPTDGLDMNYVVNDSDS